MEGKRRLGRPAGGKDLERMNCFVWEGLDEEEEEKGERCFAEYVRLGSMKELLVDVMWLVQ